MLPVGKQPFVLGWFLVIYLVLAIFILLDDKRTDFLCSIEYRISGCGNSASFIYCLLFEFK